MHAPASTLGTLLTRDRLQLTIGPFRVRVRSDVAGVGAHLERLYDKFQYDDDIGGHFELAVVASRGIRRWIRPKVRLVLNGATPYLPLPPDLAGPAFEWGLNWCIGRTAHRWVVVHSAVVERNGRTLILPGLPEVGKSTLCAALTYSGWRLFSDEFAVIDPDRGCLYPLPRPISLKDRSIDIISARHSDVVMAPERIDLEGHRFTHARPPADSVRRSQETARPGWIVLPQYRAGAPTTLERISKADALLKFADQSFNYNFLGAKGYECLASLVRAVECFKLEYSDLDDVLARLAHLAA